MNAFNVLIVECKSQEGGGGQERNKQDDSEMPIPLR